MGFLTSYINRFSASKGLNSPLEDITTQYDDEVETGLALVADVAFIYD